MLAVVAGTDVLPYTSGGHGRGTEASDAQRPDITRGLVMVTARKCTLAATGGSGPSRDASCTQLEMSDLSGSPTLTAWGASGHFTGSGRHRASLATLRPLGSVSCVVLVAAYLRDVMSCLLIVLVE